MQAIETNIATFVEVVRRRSLAATARFLHVPKSTISRRLARLEQQLDTQLVIRDSRRVEPTPEGQRFYESVVDAVDTLRHAVTGIELSGTEPRGTIRVTAPVDLGRLLLIPRFVEFLQRYPEVSLDLIFTNRMVDLAQEGIDLALRAGPVNDPSLIARRLIVTDFRLAAPLGYAIKGVDILELEQHPFVLYKSQTWNQKIRLERRLGSMSNTDHSQADEILESVELNIHGQINVDDYAAMVEFVTRGQGIGFMPAIHLDDAFISGRIAPIFKEWSLQTSDVHIVYSTRQLPERVRLLINFLGC